MVGSSKLKPLLILLACHVFSKLYHIKPKNSLKPTSSLIDYLSDLSKNNELIVRNLIIITIYHLTMLHNSGSPDRYFPDPVFIHYISSRIFGLNLMTLFIKKDKCKECNINCIKDKSKNEPKLKNFIQKRNEINEINTTIVHETTPTIKQNIESTDISTLLALSQQKTKQLAKIEQINLINSVISNADLHSGSKVNCKIKLSHTKLPDDKFDLSILLDSITSQENQEVQNGLLLFSTSGKIAEDPVNQRVENMSDPESILSKLIEFRSCTDQNCL